jgi:hypothetical protein
MTQSTNHLERGNIVKPSVLLFSLFVLACSVTTAGIAGSGKSPPPSTAKAAAARTARVGICKDENDSLRLHGTAFALGQGNQQGPKIVGQGLTGWSFNAAPILSPKGTVFKTSTVISECGDTTPFTVTTDCDLSQGTNKIWQCAGSSNRELCGRPPNEPLSLAVIAGTFLVDGTYNPQESTKPVQYTLACGWHPDPKAAATSAPLQHNASAAFKCSQGLFDAGRGYWAIPPALGDKFQTCIRAVRADYCGDGVSHTQSGTRIVLAEGVISQHEDMMTPEAEWNADGAVCVHHRRWDDERFPCCSWTQGASEQDECRALNTKPVVLFTDSRHHIGFGSGKCKDEETSVATGHADCTKDPAPAYAP